MYTTLLKTRLLGKHASTYVKTPPHKILFDLVATCNYHCVWCIRHHKKYHNTIMPKHHVTQILDRFPHTKKINYTGFGDPLIYPTQDLCELIDYLPQAYTVLTTNGSLLTPKTGKQLAATTLKRLSISINSTNPESYRKICGGNLKHVKQNIKTYQQQHPTAKLYIHGVATQQTLHELLTMPELAHQLGAHALYFLNLVRYRNATHHYTPLNPNSKNKQWINTITDKCKTLGLKHNLDKICKPRFKKTCIDPFKELNINIDYQVMPCCGELTTPLFNVEDYLDDLWNNQPMQQFRRRMLNHNFPNFCYIKCINETRYGDLIPYQ